uniref:Angiotensin-converting enzyme n=1 Tax=Trichuris muris TaxID=70415 RepID=A0A5S6QT52_TRIMR
MVFIEHCLLCRAVPFEPTDATRPPPPAMVQSSVVNKLINQLLAGNGGDFAKNFQEGVDAPESNFTATLQRTEYWDWTTVKPKGSVADEDDARAFLADYENEAANVYYLSTEAGWQFLTNMTEARRKNLVELEEATVEFLRITARRAQQYDVEAISDPLSRKLLDKLSKEGVYALPAKSFERMKGIQTKIGQIFADGAVCEPTHPPPCTMPLEPDLARIMATSTDINQLYYVWLAWRNAVGPQMRPEYMALVSILNETAHLNGLKHAGEIWQSAYGERTDLIHALEKLYDEVRPIYDQLHAYVRNHLRRQFPSFVHKDGPIPAHLLGDMSASNWINLYSKTIPFPNAIPLDITSHLRRQNFTVDKMAKMAERFYTSMGFHELPESFWKKSIFVRPVDRDLVCFPTAFDFKNGQDFRLKLCLNVNADDLLLVHQEMANTFYQISCKHQPIPFREAVNPAMGSALAKALVLSINTDAYYRDTGIVPDVVTDIERTINSMYNMALRQVAFIPFGVLADKWRWQIYSGEIQAAKVNQLWWSYREKYQGIQSPARRTELDFDAGSNFQIATNVPYNAEVISNVLKFQILKGLCETAGFQGPLHQCSLYGSKAVGEKLKRAMSMGSSKPWQEVLRILTGSSELSVAPMVEYMEPLIQWLVKKNSESGETIGWVVYTDYDDIKDGDYNATVSLRPIHGDIRKNGNSVADIEGVAFPGEDCSKGQFCLADSTCNGTVCVCPKNTILWYQNCLPNDPSMVGFGPAGPAIRLDLLEGNENTQKPVISAHDSQPSSSQRLKDHSLACLLVALVLSFLLVQLKIQ